VSDLLWCCETLTSTVDTSVALFSSVLVKRVRIQMSVVPGATAFTNEPFGLKSRLDNKSDNLTPSDTLAGQERAMGPGQLPGQTLSTGNGESRTMAYVKSLIRP
jgi:hypothetical protein